MIRLLIAISTLTACDLEYPKVHDWDDWNKIDLVKKCDKLAQCMGKIGQVISTNSKDKPYACIIGDQPGYGTYFYTTLGQFAWHDMWQDQFNQHITVCEIVTRTGGYSPEAIASRKAILDEIDKQQVEEEKALREWEKQQIEDKKLLNKIKVGP